MENYIKHYSSSDEDNFLEFRPYPSQEEGHAVVAFDQGLVGGTCAIFTFDADDLKALVDWANGLLKKMKE